jgi:hypothetical protein
MKKRNLVIGDTVKYSRIFLRNIGEMTGNLPLARGKIVAFENLSWGICKAEYARVVWDCEDCPNIIHVNNLALVTDQETESI